jgi:hypothetical protein
MADKSGGIKGYRIGAFGPGGIGPGAMKSEPPRPIPHPYEDVADPARPRHVLDYVLARRSILETIKNDVLAREKVCDADPYLIRAAKNHGEQTERNCPICAKSQLRHVTYVYGDDLGYLAGRVKMSSELPQMAQEYGHFRVYVVEVCVLCGWNHLQLSYVLGDGTPRRPPTKPRDVLE